MRCIIAIAVLMFGLTAPAWAGSDEGVAASKRGDYATVLRELLPNANQGNAAAQFALGWMYEHGRGVSKDHAEAVRWYRKAAEQGHALAPAFLGAMYAKGDGVAQDDVAALKWFVPARALGIKGRDFVATRMTPAQIAEAHRLVAEWTLDWLSRRVPGSASTR